MEGPHGQLGTRFADRLGGDDAHRFADVHRRTAGKVTPVALAANTLAAGANQILNVINYGNTFQRNEPPDFALVT